MIVRPIPNLRHLFFIKQGSIVPQVLPIMIGIVIFVTIIVLIDHYLFSFWHLDFTPMSLFGIALSLFLGFRNNAAYNRWWEARILWGQLVADSRNLMREAQLFINDEKTRKEIMYLFAAFAHFHRGRLKDIDVTDSVDKWIDEDIKIYCYSRGNHACQALSLINEQLQTAYQNGQLTEFGRMTLSNRISTIALAQAGNERIASTPLPFVYSLLVQRTAYVFCLLLPFSLIENMDWFTSLFSGIVAYLFFGLSAVTDELEHPFSDHPNGMPLNSLCRTIEISVCEGLGEPAPDKLLPENYLLM